MFATHQITFYGGSKENVRILVDMTEQRTYGNVTFQYGAMLIESEETDTLGNHARWVHFGIYNATGIECLKPGVLDARCHMGLKLPYSD